VAANYSIPSAPHRISQKIKRSLFIATLGRVQHPENADGFLAAVKKEFPDATHHCWAYNLGPPADTARLGFSDDGEPKGCAGKPILNILLHSDVGEIMAVVTRYFGGTKLGTGGLVRAYTSTVQEALEKLPLKEKIASIELTLTLDYPHAAAVEGMIANFGGVILNKEYTHAVTLKLKLDARRQTDFRHALAQTTRGCVLIL
jgi:uncharacterized YigZ family protein